jgi:hypothetical protein
MLRSMPKCGYCGTSIILGGVRQGELRFCNTRCQQSAYLVHLAQTVPADMLEKQTEEVFRGNCPRCRALGPVDVHKVHQVWSAVILTRWSSAQQVSCKSCATKSQLGGMLFSLVLGWWGFPWGLVLTPVQAVRNVVEMCGGPDPSRPSPALRNWVLMNMGAQMYQQGRASAGSVLPAISK